MPAPFSTEKDQSLVFPAGHVKPNAEKETPDKRMRWYHAHKLTGGSQYMNDTYISNDPVDQEDGDLRGKEDVEFRRMVEMERPRVWWNQERKCFIDQAAEKKLQDRIAHCRYWPLEIYRIQPPATTQKKPGAKVSKAASIF